MTHTMHYIDLPTSSYLTVVLWSLTVLHRANRARMQEWIPKLSEYLSSVKLDGYSSNLCQECVDKHHTYGYFSPFCLSTSLDTTDK